MKLISMTDFILHLRGMTTTELCNKYPKKFRLPEWRGDKDESVKDFLAIDARLWKMVGEYAKFLKQPLKLEMFVPCDEEGNVLKEPPKNWMEDFNKAEYGDFSDHYSVCFEYQKAKEKILFEGFEFEYQDGNYWMLHKGIVNEFRVYKKDKIEDLIDCYITLTPSAINQF